MFEKFHKFVIVNDKWLEDLPKGEQAARAYNQRYIFYQGKQRPKALFFCFMGLRPTAA
jgi:hypothetical protein